MDEIIRLEFDNHDKRISALEQKMENLTDMNLNIQRIAMNTEQLTRDIARTNTAVDDLGTRIGIIEQKPAEAWTSTRKTIFNTLLGAACSAIVAIVGALFYFAITSLM